MRLLDLFCNAGGAGAGYARAGFEVVGVDLHPQKRYPFAFIQHDALALDLQSIDVAQLARGGDARPPLESAARNVACACGECKPAGPPG